MKLFKVCVAIGLLIVPLHLVSQKLYAADLDLKVSAQTIASQDSGEKTLIKANKQKISEERDGILSAGRRLDQAKKTRDKAQIELVKKEVDAEIKERKARIVALKDDIERMQQGRESIAPSRKGRAKEGKY